MATTDNTIVGKSSQQPEWPNEPEGMLALLPERLTGSPFEMLACSLSRAQGIVELLSADLISDGDCRPTNKSITNVLWSARGHLNLALELLEHLGTEETPR
jgi:hypothetical protein